MSEHQKMVCDRFVYIPQYGVGTASLNVNVATCLVLHTIVGRMKTDFVKTPV